MAKPIKVSDEGVVTEAVKGDREARWEAFVASYAQKNPVKYALKRATKYVDENPQSPTFGKELDKPDEFATIPASFK